MNPLKVTAITSGYDIITNALKANDFNKSKAAKYLGIDRKTLYNKLKLYEELQEEIIKNPTLVPDYHARMPENISSTSVSISKLPFQRPINEPLPERLR